MRLALTLALLTAAPASALPHPTTDAAMRDYLHGRLADADVRTDDAARFYSRALAASPGDATLQRRAFDSALAAGDEARATTLARDLEAAGQGDAATALVRLADAIKRRDWTTAAAVKGLPDTGYAAVVAPVTAAWIRVGRGDAAGALALVDPDRFTGIARSYVVEHRAMILAAVHRDTEAAPLFTAMLAAEAKTVDRLRVTAAASLAAGGARDAARAMLAAGEADPVLAAALRRLAAGQVVAPPPDPRTGIAVLAMRLAGDLARERPVPLATVFARQATFLAPERAETWLVAGDVLLRSARPAAALAAYAQIPARDPLGPEAAVRRGAAQSALGRDDAARTLFEAAAARADATADDWERLGDLERKLGRPREAGADYTRAIALAGTGAGWQLFFLRGAALEQAGDWAAAEPDLRAALQRAPDEPTVLNYLGYALLDRGQKLDEATALIATAARLRPDDGAIADSLGWAYFRRGDFARAVTTLEGAVRQEPGDATISEHLGDAYWRVGRQLEARFRWRAALDLSPEPKAAALLAKKLDFGLDVATAAR